MNRRSFLKSIIAASMTIVSTSAVASVVKRKTGAPYFTIPAEGWGAGWSVDQGTRFDDEIRVEKDIYEEIAKRCTDNRPTMYVFNHRAAASDFSEKRMLSATPTSGVHLGNSVAKYNKDSHFNVQVWDTVAQEWSSLGTATNVELGAPYTPVEKQSC